MEPIKWCNGVGPFQALCEREAHHAGKHEGHDAHGYMYHWKEEDYPSSPQTHLDLEGK